MARPPVKKTAQRRIPVDSQPELAVLATVLSRPETYADLVELNNLTYDDFGVDIHSKVWEAIVACDINGRPIEAITVADEMRRSGIPDEAVDKVLADITEATANSSNVEHYVTLVQGNAHLRNCLAIADEIAAAATAHDADPDAVVQQAQELAFRISGDKPSQTLRLASDHMGEVIKHLTTPRTTPLLGHSTGWAGLDKMTAGFEGGNLIIAAGRPATGKSVFGLNLAVHIAKVSGDAVAYLSWEMSSKELLIRAMASELGYDSLKLKQGDIPPEMMQDLHNTAAQLGTLPLYIDDQPANNINSIRAQMRRLHRRTPLAAIVMDYLQLIEGDPRLSSQRHLQLGQISRGAKLMASELDIPVIALAQVNREVEKRPGFKPVLADLKDSGSLEQDASMVIFLNRPAAFDDNYEDKQEAAFIVSKNRNGPVGDVPVRFQASYNRFVDVSDSRAGRPGQSQPLYKKPPSQEETYGGGRKPYNADNDVDDPWA